jgi:hypothetical protein
VEPVTPADIEALLASAYRHFFDACVEHKALAQLFLQETLFDAELRARRAEIYEAFAGLAQRGLDVGVAMRVLRPMNTRVVAYAIVGLVERVATQWLLYEEKSELDTLVEELARFEARGLVQPGEEPA